MGKIYISDPLDKQSPTFLALGTGFVEDNFSTAGGWEEGVMVQAVMGVMGSGR